MKGNMIICCLLFALNAAAQEQMATDSAAAQEQMATDSVRTEKSSTGLMAKLRLVQQFLDNKARRSVDPHYIEVPEKPWRVILRYKETAVNVDYSNSLDFPEYNEHVDWKMEFEPPVAASVGFWVGYRGTGISYSQSLVKNAGRYFSISTTGAKYGLNFRLRRFSTDDVSLSGKDYINGQVDYELSGQGKILSPVWIRSTYINGYYVFNGRRYSQAAAYNQSVIQRRSAGSLLAGATWYQSSFDMSAPENALFTIGSKGIGRIKVHQANIGVGYGYNFVPFRGFVINLMAMPTISVYNRVKAYTYDFNYDLSDITIDPDDYGEWNSETRTWANGMTHKPMDDDLEWVEDVEIWETGDETSYGRLQFNVDVRLGIAYNWGNYFIGLQSQFNRFSYKKNPTKVVLIDGYARLSLGVRL